MKRNPINYLRSIKRRLVRQMNAGGQVGLKNKATRDFWLENILRRIPVGSRILDAGAGELQYKPLCSHLDYVSQDFNQYDGVGDSKGLQTGKWNGFQIDIVSDITQIPQPNSSFDAVLCVEVFEHIPAPVDALRELTRLLKPGGILILTAPFCSLTHFAPYYYQSGYSQYFYEYWLGKFNFDIEEMAWNGNYFEYMAQELRRLPSISRQYTSKKLSWTDWLATQQLLKTLNKLSKDDNGSEQLLSFGLHICARKLK